MSFVVTQPESHAAASDLHAVGGAMAAHNEVSELAATQFAMHAQPYQGVAAEAVAIHELFTTNLAIGGGWYAATEPANATAAG
jgi:PE family